MPPPSRRKTRVTARPLLDGFSDADLANLAKCVSCDIRWTTRKGAAQKMTHIKSCAKKRSFSDETVRILILRELENVLPPEHGKGKGKDKALPQAPIARDTIFAGVVQDAAPKKRTKRAHVLETVKTPADRRESILARAKNIIGREDTHAPDEEQDFAPDPPATQPFGFSNLARKQPAKPSMFFGSSGLSDAENSDQEMPLATQPFIPSRLDKTPLGSSWDIAGAPPSPILAHSDAMNRPSSPTKYRNVRVSFAIQCRTRLITNRNLLTLLLHPFLHLAQKNVLRDDGLRGRGVQL